MSAARDTMVPMVAHSVFGSAVLVYGPESLLATRAVSARVAQAQQEAPDAEFNEMTASELGKGDFAEVIGGSLFSSHSVVVVQDLAGLPSELNDLVLGVATNPPPELCLSLVHSGGVRGKGLVDKLRAAKVPRVEAASLKAYELPGFVTAEARRHRLSFDATAAAALVDAVGTDLSALEGAVSQLAADYEGSQVSAAMVNRYFAGRADVTSFAVADDVFSGRRVAALGKLRWALQTGVAPMLITSALASGLRNLGKYLDLRGARLPDVELARQVGVPPWKLKDLAKQSRAWTPARVADGIQKVAVADSRVKGAATDPEFALEQLVLTLTPASFERPAG